LRKASSTAAEPSRIVLGDACEIGEKRENGGAGGVRLEMMLGDPGLLEAERLGLAHQARLRLKAAREILLRVFVS
jgi:hypothetical protein